MIDLLDFKDKKYGLLHQMAAGVIATRDLVQDRVERYDDFARTMDKVRESMREVQLKGDKILSIATVYGVAELTEYRKVGTCSHVLKGQDPCVQCIGSKMEEIGQHAIQRARETVESYGRLA